MKSDVGINRQRGSVAVENFECEFAAAPVAGVTLRTLDQASADPAASKWIRYHDVVNIEQWQGAKGRHPFEAVDQPDRGSAGKCEPPCIVRAGREDIAEPVANAFGQWSPSPFAAARVLVEQTDQTGAMVLVGKIDTFDSNSVGAGRLGVHGDRGQIGPGKALP